MSQRVFMFAHRHNYNMVGYLCGDNLSLLLTCQVPLLQGSQLLLQLSREVLS